MAERSCLDIDEGKLKELAADAITQVFRSSKVVEFNQAKWIGFDESLDSYIQNHAVNGVGYGAWRVLLGQDPDAESDNDNDEVANCDATASADCQAIIPYTDSADGIMSTQS